MYYNVFNYSFTRFSCYMLRQQKVCKTKLSLEKLLLMNKHVPVLSISKPKLD